MNDPSRATAATRPLGRILVEAGLVSPEDLERALARKQGTGARIGQTLVAMGLIDEATLARALALQGRLPCVELCPELVDPRVARALDPEQARALRCVPLNRVAGVVTLAMEDPDDEAAVAAAAAALGAPVFAVHADAERIEECLRLVLERRPPAGEALLDAAISAVDYEGTPAGEDLFEEEGLEGPVQNLIQSLVEEAVAGGATRLSFEPRGARFVVRMRKDGELVERLELARGWARPVVARLKLMAGLDLRERRRPQAGLATLRLGDAPRALRLATAPTLHGECAALDLRAAAPPRALGELGLEPEDEARLRALRLDAGGLLLVVARSGAGRTTTLHALLRELATPERRAFAVEPPDLPLPPEVTRLATAGEEPLAPADALRAALGQDADLVLLDALDDAETARLALRAALGGATVLAGLFAADAPEAVERLLDLGLEPWLVAGALRGVLRQGLVPRLCPACRRPADPDPALRARLGLEGVEGRWQRRVGCRACHERGLDGRLALFELVTPGGAARELLRAGARGPALCAALAPGARSLRARAIALARAGETSLREALPLLAREPAERPQTDAAPEEAA